MSPHRISRRTFMKSLSLAAAAAMIPAPLRAAQGKRPKNIVLIYADDLGYGDVSCYGARDFETPNIDRIAAEGVRFTHAHSASATCTSAISPAFGSLT